MPDGICRLSVQSSDGERVTDLVLPADTAVEFLLPSIVTLAQDGTDTGGREWRLDDIAGMPVDRTQSLGQNGIHDGALLILRPESAPAFGSVRSRTVPASADARSDVASNRLQIPVLHGWAVAQAGLLFVWPGEPVSAVIACGTALVIIAMALWQGRSGHTGQHGAAIALGGVGGFLAVPGGPAAPNVLLGSAVALSVALMLARTGTHRLAVAAVAFSLPLVLSSALSTWVALPLGAAGAAAAILALIGLTLAPRTAIIVGRQASDGDATGLDVAQTVLTGLVFGSSAATAIGAGVAVASSPHARLASLVFSWALAAAMLLRVPSYGDPARRWAVMLSGIFCATTAFAVTAWHFPQYGPWLGLALTVTTLMALRLGPPSPAVGRWLVRAEYLALAAVVPAALWVCGVYSLAQTR